MTFDEAMTRLRAGARVRRKDWLPATQVFVLNPRDARPVLVRTEDFCGSIERVDAESRLSEWEEVQYGDEA